MRDKTEIISSKIITEIKICEPVKKIQSKFGNHVHIRMNDKQCSYDFNIFANKNANSLM